MSFTIRKAVSEEFSAIELLADKIWREHYTPIIGVKQVDYMLNKFQSTQAMLKQIEDGYEYYVSYLDDKLVGYLCIREEDSLLFLSKIYLDSSMRGKGFGKEGISFVEKTANDRGLKGIRLTVNKFNTNTIAAYKKMGFIETQELVMDIGEGFVMDDYEMIKWI